MTRRGTRFLLPLVLVALGADRRELSKLDDVVRVRVVNQSLHVEWVAPMQAPVKPMTVQGPEAAWRVRASRDMPGGIKIERPPARVPGEGAGYWHVSISVGAAPDQLVITGRRGGRTVNDTVLRFSQAAAGRGAHLVVSDNVAHKVAQARGDNLFELRASDPRLVRETLVPLLRQLTGRDPLVPGATDVYAVFEELAPDERVAAEVRGLVAELGHPSFARREAASARLNELTPQSVCAVMHMDRDSLMPEQQVRLDALLADHAHRATNDPRAARRDVAFLADCLEFPGDARVRWAAKRDIERLTNRSIPLHHAPTDAEWSHAADVVRRLISLSPSEGRGPGEG